MKNIAILQTGQGKQWLRFQNPIKVIQTTRLEDVAVLLPAVTAAALRSRLYAVGFLTYEAATAFYADVASPAPNGMPQKSPFPYLWFALYSPENVTPIKWRDLVPSAATSTYTPWQMVGTAAAYLQSIQTYQNKIVQGKARQIYASFPARTQLSGDPLALFCDMVQAQNSHYAAYLDIGSHQIISAADSLLFALNEKRLTTLLVQGTIARGDILDDDIAQANRLKQAHAQNKALIEAIQADVARIAIPGTVPTPPLLEIARTPYRWQMTAALSAETEATIPDVMTALLPSPLVTGVPKPGSMKMNQELESTPRGLHTGTIGYIDPQGNAQFNVVTNTVVTDLESGRSETHIGTIITNDSDSLDLLSQSRQQLQQLGQPWPEFELVESLLWTPEEGYFLLERHLDRLDDSARYFDIKYDNHRLRTQLMKLWFRLAEEGAQKVYIYVAFDGSFRTEATPLNELPVPERPRIGLAAAPIDSRNLFLYHKTTHRQLYEEVKASHPQYDDVILWNEHGEITETTTSNIVVEIDGVHYTPPVSCGLLPGTFRAELLMEDEIQERIIRVDELARCQRIWLINSIREWRETLLVEATTPL